jgi:hypothetical protein
VGQWRPHTETARKFPNGSRLSGSIWTDASKTNDAIETGFFEADFGTLAVLCVRCKENAMTKKRDKICESFSQVGWHDSKLLGIYLSRHPEKPQFDVRFDLNLIVGYAEAKIERRKQSALFSDCRIILADVDLLGVLLCSGHIGAAGCYPDSAELEKRKRDKIRLFDLPQDLNPLQECVGFFFEMVPPGGQIIIFAKDFELT